MRVSAPEACEARLAESRFISHPLQYLVVRRSALIDATIRPFKLASPIHLRQGDLEGVIVLLIGRHLSRFDEQRTKGARVKLLTIGKYRKDRVTLTASWPTRGGERETRP